MRTLNNWFNILLNWGGNQLKQFLGRLILGISKVMNMEFNDFVSKFDSMNVKSCKLQVELMDGSLHMIDVGNHDFIWEDEEDVENK